MPGEKGRHEEIWAYWFWLLFLSSIYLPKWDRTYLDGLDNNF